MPKPTASPHLPPRRRIIGAGFVSIAAWKLSCLSSKSLFAQSAVDEEPKRVVVGVMGLSRGLSLASDLLKIPGVELKYLCDVDQKRSAAGIKSIADKGGDAMPVQDFRTMLDDKEVDALFCAAPNHWHGPATILGCKAGKHVYVEKPASHNPQEGEWMIEAAAKYQRCVQVGTQRRSSPGIQAGIAKLHAGAIGQVYQARAFFSQLRPTIGRKSDTTAPATLDYDLWQGPAPRKPFRENVVPYNWHWFWHWGNGELGNNGIHLLDLCRWGMQVDYPIRTVSSGGQFGFDDDQETPDVHHVAWEFEGKKQITYQGNSRTKSKLGPFAAFYGTDGSLELDGDGTFRIFDKKDKLVEETSQTSQGQPEHIANFIHAIRTSDPKKLAQPVESGHRSTLLCLLGNISYRTDRVIHTRAVDGHITDDGIPSHLWRREYDSVWEKDISQI
jgi:predicted dehydrogenase